MQPVLYGQLFLPVKFPVFNIDISRQRVYNKNIFLLKEVNCMDADNGKGIKPRSSGYETHAAKASASLPR